MNIGKSNDGAQYFVSKDTISQVQMEGASFSRKVVVELLESQRFKVLLLTIIILNALALGLETNIATMKYFDWYLGLLNNVFLGIYLFELSIKIYGYRMEYFKSGWNVFDMLVILLTLIAWIVNGNVDLSVEVEKLFSIIRIFRSLLIIPFLRELKGVPFLRSLQLIIDTIFASFATIGSVGFLAGVFLYLFTVSAVILFGDANPSRFGKIGTAFVSTFQVITLDRWSEIYTDNTENKSIWVLGFVIIIFETFVFENLFVAVIINNLKGSRELVELRKKKQIAQQKKYKPDDRGSKTSLGREKSTRESLGKLFEQQHGINDYYPPYLSNRLKELLSSYYRNLAFMDHAQEAKIRHDKVLGDLMDLAINYQNKEFD